MKSRKKAWERGKKKKIALTRSFHARMYFLCTFTYNQRLYSLDFNRKNVTKNRMQPKHKDWANVIYKRMNTLSSNTWTANELAESALTTSTTQTSNLSFEHWNWCHKFRFTYKSSLPESGRIGQLTLARQYKSHEWRQTNQQTRPASKYDMHAWKFEQAVSREKSINRSLCLHGFTREKNDCLQVLNCFR